MCVERNQRNRCAPIAALSSVFLSGGHAVLDKGMVRNVCTLTGLVLLGVALTVLYVDRRSRRNIKAREQA